MPPPLSCPAALSLIVLLLMDPPPDMPPPRCCGAGLLLRVEFEMVSMPLFKMPPPSPIGGGKISPNPLATLLLTVLPVIVSVALLAMPPPAGHWLLWIG